MTNTSDDTPRPGEMTDEQLDQLLTAASINLLDHITATADPNRTLTAIMDRADQQAPAETPVSTMIRFRDAAHDIASALTLAPTSADDIEHAHSVVRTLGSALVPDLASDPVRVLERTHDLGRTRSLVARLDGDIGNLRDRYFHQRGDDLFEPVRVDRRVGPGLGGRVDGYDPLARGVDRARVDDRDLLLARALDQARAIAQDFDSIELDASGEDLSGIEIRHLDAVDGITWTRETTWPSAITADVEENSYEIQPGVYQVHLGDTRARHMLLTPA